MTPRRPGPALVVLLLALVISPEVAAVGMANNNTNTPATGSLSWGNTSIREGGEFESKFTTDYGYQVVAWMVFIAMIFVCWETMRHQRLQMTYAKTCHLKPPYGVFAPVSKALGADLLPMQFKHTVPVVVSGFNYSAPNQPTPGAVRIVPYTGQTKWREGFLAMMINEAEDVPNNIHDPLCNNSLLVALGCESLTDDQIEHILADDLQSFVDDRVNYFKVQKLTFFDLNFDADLNHVESEYCPSDSKVDDVSNDWITVVKKGQCAQTWPNGYPQKRGIKLWLEQFMEKECTLPRCLKKLKQAHESVICDASTSLPGNITGHGCRTNLHITGHRSAASWASFLLWIILPMWTFIVTMPPFGHAAFEFLRGYEDTEFYRYFYLWPKDTNKDTDLYLMLKVLSGPLILTALLLIRGGLQKLWQKRASKRGGEAVDMVGPSVWWSKTFIVAAVLYCPSLLYVTSKYINNYSGKLINAVETALSWINYQLALIYLLNVLLLMVNKYYNLGIPDLINPDIAEIILGSIGVASALMDLVDHTRAGHGMDDGCEIEELGNTFRIIARDHPQSFPHGASIDLTCTESDLTFSDVFNRTNNSLVPRFDDGNMCLLTCTMPTAGDPPRIPTSTLPIWCKNNGLAGARWTLSAHKGLLAPRLCPPPTRQRPPPATNFFSVAPIRDPE